MRNHLRTHDINLQLTSNKNDQVGAQLPPSKIFKKYNDSSPSTSTLSILPYVRRQSLEEILAKCAAKDGISFNTNFTMPNSATTVQKLVLKYFEEKKTETKELIQKRLKLFEKFSITVDEWTDIASRRYLNVTLQLVAQKIVLGLVPIIESWTSEKTEELIFNRLAEYGVNFNTDIVASSHDGVSVMVKYGRIISAESQCCYNHAIHLTVVDTFYKEINRNHVEDDSSGDEDSEGAVDSESDADDYIEDTYIFKNRQTHATAITEMRKAIKFFIKSPLRTETLTKHVIVQEGKELKLLLDVKTRWSSLVISIERFLKLIIPINTALSEFGATEYNQDNIEKLKEMVTILEPLRLAVLELSKEDAKEDATINYVFHQLQKIKTPLAEECMKNLHIRIENRRKKDLMTLIMFLHSGVYPKITDFFSYSTKAAVKTLVVSLITRLFPNESNELESDVECTVNDDLSPANE